jgi:predicted transcriptional regulator
MDARKKKHLRAVGWRVGTVTDFLGLNEQEAALVEMKAALGMSVRGWRMRAHLTQTSLAGRLKSSQSRVAKLEAGDPTVTLDLLVRAAIAAGASTKEIARALAAEPQIAAG